MEWVLVWERGRPARLAAQSLPVMFTDLKRTLEEEKRLLRAGRHFRHSGQACPVLDTGAASRDPESSPSPLDSSFRQNDGLETVIQDKRARCVMSARGVNAIP